MGPLPWAIPPILFPLYTRALSLPQGGHYFRGPPKYIRALFSRGFVYMISKGMCLFWYIIKVLILLVGKNPRRDFL
jgi:hypothetical protein